MAVKSTPRRSESRSDTEAAPRLRRAYFECRHGQLHVSNAMPTGGGFDEATTLLCVHPAAAAGRVFRPLLAAMGVDRSLYAPDLPGCGESDPPPSPISVADYAVALADFVDSMRFRQIDLLGWREGSAIAAELALLRPQIVRRLVMVSLPSGGRGEGRSATGDESDGGVRDAVERWDARQRLPSIAQPTLVVRPADDLAEATSRGRSLIKQARSCDLAVPAQALFATSPQTLVTALREFLGGGAA